MDSITTDSLSELFQYHVRICMWRKKIIDGVGAFDRPAKVNQ